MGAMLARPGPRSKRIVPLWEVGIPDARLTRPVASHKNRAPHRRNQKPGRALPGFGRTTYLSLDEDQRFLLFFPAFPFFAFLGAALAFFFGPAFFTADFFARFAGAFLPADLRAAGRVVGAAATPGRSEMTNSSSLSSSMISSGSPPSSSSSSKCTNSLSSPGI